MKFSNSIELEIRGERALFRDPLRPQTLPVPSCEALKGILGSIYWNPDFIWVPDSLRVMEPIGYTREGARTSDGSRFTNADVHCLKDVRYQLRAHFVWNEQRPGSVKLTERDEIRHFRIALRSLARGGRRWVCLGRADCPAAVRSVHFGEGAGAYDNGKAVSLGILYHSFDYTAGEPRYFNCIMESGVIRYSAQELFTLPELANKRRYHAAAKTSYPARPQNRFRSADNRGFSEPKRRPDEERSPQNGQQRARRHIGGVHSQEAPERACRAGSADSDLPAGAPRRRPRTAALRAPGELRYSGGGMPALVRRPRVRAGVFLQGNARAGS